MDLEQTLLGMIGAERNIYQQAELYPQRRRHPREYADRLACPGCGGGLECEPDVATCPACSARFAIERGVIDLTPASAGGRWRELTERFERYHRALTPFTLFSEIPICHYVALRSGLFEARDLAVLDAGGGTGHALCSFFRHPHTLDYTLLDPCVRLLHDSFVRVYPALLTLPMAHVLGVGEALPFAAERFDLVMSCASIDHMRAPPEFAREAARVLRPGGRLLIYSNLQGPARRSTLGARVRKLLSPSGPERLARSLFRRRNRVALDDHTFHFTDVEQVGAIVKDAGLEVTRQEAFKGHFFVMGTRPGGAP